MEDELLHYCVVVVTDQVGSTKFMKFFANDGDVIDYVNTFGTGKGSKGNSFHKLDRIFSVNQFGSTTPQTIAVVDGRLGLQAVISSDKCEEAPAEPTMVGQLTQSRLK